MPYDSNAARLCLGAMLIKPNLSLNEKYKLDKGDFEQSTFHMRLYQAIVALAKHGAQEIGALDVYNLCRNNHEVKQIFDQNDLSGFIDTIKQLANVDNFELYWLGVRRCSLLSKYAKEGFDISRFENDIEKYSIEDIVNYYDGVNIHIKKEFYRDESITELKAGDGFEKVKENFKAEPLYGATTFSRYLNTAVRGWIPGQMSIYSIDSGTGKSTIGLANLVSVCCTRIYDLEQERYVDNPCYQHKGGLYIQFEMAGDTEVSPKIVATISGVPCFNILNGHYEDGEEERVDEAIKILHESNLYIVTIPNYTVDLIEQYVKDYVLTKNVGYVCYDYIVESSSVSSDIAKKNGVATRSDQVLSGIASKLKDLAVEYNIAVLTFTQTSAASRTQEIMGAECIAGSRAVQNKADVAGVLVPLRQKEQEIADMVCEGNPNIPMPNRVLACYKMRFGAVEKDTKIYLQLDLNTGRMKDCFVTNKYDKPITLAKTNLVYSND